MAQVLSPVPGTFYVKPSPEEPPFKSPGDPVSVGDTIGLVEVMKTFIQVNAETAGTFGTYVAEDGLPVTAGAVLAEVTE